VKQLDDAIDSYKKVISVEPLNMDAQKELAQIIWMRTGDQDDALKELSEAINRYPRELGLKIMQAEIFGQMGNITSHYSLMKTCFEKSNEDAGICFYMSKAALRASKFTEALEFSSRAMAVFSNDLQCCIHHINCLLANGHVEIAMQILETLTKSFPNNQHIIALQASCWRLTGDERYNTLYNYEHFVAQLPLGVPSGWSSLDSYINDLESELDLEHGYIEHPFFLSVQHGSQIASITESNRPAMKAFELAIQSPVSEYLTRLHRQDSPSLSRMSKTAKLFSAWSVKLRSRGFHLNHVHQEGWLSSACHIRVPEHVRANQSKEGWLKLGEPGPVTKPSLRADKFIKPKRGMIVIFPSYIWHGTVAFSDDETRLTVATDLVPGDDKY